MQQYYFKLASYIYDNSIDSFAIWVKNTNTTRHGNPPISMREGIMSVALLITAREQTL